MGKAQAQHILQDLRQRISRLENAACSYADKSLPFGIDPVDQHLSGGLPLGVIHEIMGAETECDEAAATLFVAGIMARTTGPILWCVTSFDLFIHGLANVGLRDDRIIIVEARDEKTVLLVMEEGLRHGGLSSVVGEVSLVSPTSIRRLHLASRTSGVTGYLLRRRSRYKKYDPLDVAAVSTRWRIASLPSSPLPAEGIGRAQWRIELIRSQAGAGEWIMEACDASGYLAVPANLSHRQDQETKSWRLSA